MGLQTVQSCNFDLRLSHIHCEQVDKISKIQDHEGKLTVPICKTKLKKCQEMPIYLFAKIFLFPLYIGMLTSLWKEI